MGLSMKKELLVEVEVLLGFNESFVGLAVCWCSRSADSDVSRSGVPIMPIIRITVSFNHPAYRPILASIAGTSFSSSSSVDAMPPAYLSLHFSPISAFPLLI